MTDTLTRRTLVKGAAWSVPVLALAVSTPLAAASEAPAAAPLANRLRLTNVTLTVGREANKLYFNTTVQVNDGPAPVENLVLVVTLSRDGEAVTRTFPYTPGWGNTGRVALEFADIPKGADVIATATAWADGVERVTGTDAEGTPSWWN